jgi:hypothetical protein
MATKALSQTSVDLGSEIVAVVDRIGLEPEGAFWLLDEESGEWHFYIVSSLIDVAGPRWMFLRLNRVLPELVLGLPPDFDLRLGSPKEVLADEVRRTVGKLVCAVDKPQTLDFGEGKQNLVVYRMARPMPEHAMHQSRVRFRRKLQEIEQRRVA